LHPPLLLHLLLYRSLQQHAERGGCLLGAGLLQQLC
jgi:hypothetical protein